MQTSREWVVVGSYDTDDGRCVSEIMAEGFRSEEAANEARNHMRLSAPEVSFEVLPREYASRWVR